MSELFENRILIVDDEKDNIDVLTVLLEKERFEVVSALSGKEALEKTHSSFFNVILLDIRMPGMNGIEVLKELQEESPQSLVVLFTAHGTREHIKSALKADVYDVIEKPIDNELLLLKIKKAFEHSDSLLRNEQLEKEVLKKYPYKNIVGTSSKMKEIFKMIEKVAPTDICVLITGETGTGKELVARAIHAKSKRPGPFIPVNAGALSETLLENELFGHEKGSFTDAKERKYGYFESCKDGTIFLDEIGDISPQMQLSLLRVLQEKKIIRVGGTKQIEVNARVITATNKNIEKLIKEKIFRDDLYFRIKDVSIHLHPLRERREDIPHLIKHFIKKYSNKEVKISPEAMELLMSYDWPGNIRVLEQTIKLALIFQKDNIIHPRDFPPEIMGRTMVSVSEIFNLPWEKAKSMFEKRYIEEILAQTNGNISEASRMSGIDRSYLHKQIKKYGIKK